MTSSDTLLDALERELRKTARTYNSNNEFPPEAVLWPDEVAQWVSLLPDLRARLPILTLGAYDAAAWQGPAYWILAVLAGAIDLDLPEGVPVIYLPGIGIGDLRDAEHAPAGAQALLSLRYRGTTQLYVNNKDLTVNAFLGQEAYSTGLKVEQDAETQRVLIQSLPRLARESLAVLRTQPVSAATLHALALPDPALNVLRWLDDDTSYRAGTDTEAWAAFRSVLLGQYGVDPEADGPLVAARKLGQRANGNWERVWLRYEEAPSKYPGIPDRLRAAKPQQELPLFRTWAWPQDNDTAEAELHRALAGLPGEPGAARAAIAALERDHAVRRDTVWAQLGQSPLARALRHLATIANLTANPLAGPNLDALITAYTEWGWRVDDAALNALAGLDDCPNLTANRSAVGTAIARLTTAWLDAAARAFQQHLRTPPPTAPVLDPPAGTCVLFADGLRYDLGAQLAASFPAAFTVSLGTRLAALPGVTPTAKPAVSPLAPELEPGKEFGVRLPGSASNMIAPSFRKALAERGWTVLEGDERACPAAGARGWLETGNIDSFGHNHPHELPSESRRQVARLRETVTELLAAGWARVMVVTDHGWLYLPGEGLPTVTLPEHLTVSRKARCARLNASASTEMRTLPWHWDPEVRMAYGPGIAAFTAGTLYDHGGLSLQECVTPLLTISAEKQVTPLQFGTVRWRGLRADVEVSGGAAGVTLDIRTKPNDPSTSILLAPVALGGADSVVLTVGDDDTFGATAMLVATVGGGAPIASRSVVIGENE